MRRRELITLFGDAGASWALGCLSELSATLAKITQAIDYVLDSPDL
jgi:hypothetical protein